MKYFLVFCITIVLISAEVNYEELKATYIFPNIMRCKEETGASDEDLSIVSRQVLPETENGKCFHKCVMEAIGLFRDCKLSHIGAREAAAAKSEDQAFIDACAQISDACEDTTGTDCCDIAVKSTACAVKESIKLGVDPAMSVWI